MAKGFDYSLEDRELFLEFLKMGTVWGIYEGMSETELFSSLGAPAKGFTLPYCTNPELDTWVDLYCAVYEPFNIPFEVYLSPASKVVGLGVDPVKSEYLEPSSSASPATNRLRDVLESRGLVSIVRRTENQADEIQLFSGVTVYGSDSSGYAERFFS